MNQSYWLDHKIKNSTPSQKKYDAIIIGGGIAGLSTAYWLQQQDPNLKIGVLEKNKIASGASGKNAGFVTCGSLEHFIKLKKQFGSEKAVEIWKFSEDNRKLLLEHIIQDQTQNVDFRHTGSCTVAPSADHWAEYRQVAKQMFSSGIDVHEVNPQDLERDYGVTGFEGGVQYTGDGYVHPVKLIHLLRQKLTCEIHENTEVLSVKSGLSTQIIETSSGSFEAAEVFVTLNAYLPLVLKEFKELITPGRGQILLTEPLPDFVKGPCYLTKHLCYFRQLPTGHLLIGGFRNLAPEAETTYVDGTTDLIQSALFDFVKSHFKYGPQAKVAYQWSGIMGFSPDGQMMIGSPSDNSHIHLMAGCSGHGMGLSFNAAKTLVNHFMKKAVPQHLRLDRFHAK